MAIDNRRQASATAIRNEYAHIVTRIVDSFVDELRAIDIELLERRRKNEPTLEALARIAELKVRKAQIIRMQRKINSILQLSTNKLIISTIEPVDN